MFVGLKSGRIQSKQIELPGWIDESRALNVSAIKVSISLSGVNMEITVNRRFAR